MHAQLPRIIVGTDGYPRVAPIESPRQAINEIQRIFNMVGYDESQGDLWLGGPLARVLDYLYAKDNDDAEIIKRGIRQTRHDRAVQACWRHYIEGCGPAYRQAWAMAYERVKESYIRIYGEEN